MVFAVTLSILARVTFHVVVVHFLLPGVDFFGGGMQRLVLVVWIGQTIPTVPAGITAADRDIAKLPGRLDGNFLLSLRIRTSRP